MKSLSYFIFSFLVFHSTFGQERKLGTFLILMQGGINNRSVENKVNDDIRRDRWIKSDSLSGTTFVAGLGLIYKFHPRSSSEISAEYMKSSVGSHSPVKNPYGGYEGNNISYIYSRFSTNILCHFHQQVYKRFYAQLGGGFSYSYLSLRKSSGSSDAFAFTPDSVRHFTTTWNAGLRIRGGLSLKIAKRWYAELSVLKDFLKPKKVSGLTMNYDLFAVEFRMGFFIL